MQDGNRLLSILSNWAKSWRKQQKCMCASRRQIILGILQVWSESSLSTWRKLASLATQWAHSKDFDQNGRMPRLIWLFAGRTFILSSTRLEKWQKLRQGLYEKEMHIFRLWRKHVQSFKKIGINCMRSCAHEGTHCLYIEGEKWLSSQCGKNLRLRKWQS